MSKEIQPEGNYYDKYNSKNPIEQKLMGNFFTGSIYQIAEPDCTYDLVVASEVMEHLEEPENALRELLRVSKNWIMQLPSKSKKSFHG